MYEFVQDINFLWIGQATGNLYHLWLRVECTLFGYLQSRSNNVCNMRLHFVKGKVFIHIANGRFNFALIYSHLKSPREKVEIWMVFTKVSYFLPSLVMGITHWLKQKGHLSVIMKSELIFSFWCDIWSVTSWYDAVHS